MATIQQKIDEIQENMSEMPMHLYILIWAVTDMTKRMRDNPKSPKFCEISYPFSPVPLFSKQEAVNLEKMWRENIEGKEIFTNTPQQGGGMKLPSVGALKEKAAAFGQDMNFALKALDPKKISPDYLYGYTTDLFDSVDSKLTQASGNFGVVALETTIPDPNLIIPTVPPIPIPIPARSIFPMINALMETIRITAGVFQLMDPIGLMDPLGLAKNTRVLMTLLMVLLDLSRGNLYHAIFTSMGFMGSMPMFVGIGLKIMRDAIMLVSPDIRKEFRDLLFKGSKSFVVGYHIWLFTTLSPGFVKKPIATLFDAVSLQLETLNAQIDAAETTANMGPLSAVASIRLPRIPTDKIPDINNLYALREAIRLPQIYCDPKISSLMEELRAVPPYALFFDFALIPQPNNPEYTKTCAPLKGASLQDNLVAASAPQIIPNGMSEPLPLEIIPVAESPLSSEPQSVISGPQPVTSNLNTHEVLQNPQVAVSNLLSKSPVGQLLGTNPLDTLQNPQAAASAAASNLLSKSPVGKLLGNNPLDALQNPQAAASTAISDTLSKNPVSQLLGAPLLMKASDAPKKK